MPQCKVSGCREEAVPTGKRYCPAHKALYEAKQREYNEIQKTLRCCEDCGEKLSKTRHDAGEVKCGRCFQESEAARIESEEAGRRHREKMDRLAELDACETVSQLRDYIRRHLFR